MNKFERCMKAVSAMNWLVMKMTTVEHETDFNWWSIRAYIIAHDKDKPILKYMKDRLKQRRN